MTQSIQISLSPARIGTALMLLLVVSGVLPVSAWAADATACTASEKPWLSLRIATGTAIAVADRDVLVLVYNDGCVALHRPAFYRLAGDFRLDLSTDELASLRAQVDSKQLRAFDAAKVRAALSQSQRSGAKSASGNPEDFAVLDADHYALELQVGGKTLRAAWSGLHSYAEYYPEVLELKQLSVLVRTVQALLAREDGVRVQGAAP